MRHRAAELAEAQKAEHASLHFDAKADIILKPAGADLGIAQRDVTRDGQHQAECEFGGGGGRAGSAGVAHHHAMSGASRDIDASVARASVAEQP